MKNKNKVITFMLLASFAIIFIGCEENISTEIDKDLVVVQGFLYEGQPVKDISLSEVLPLGSLDTLAAPINGAAVSVSNSETKYLLIPDEEKEGYYYYPEDDFTVNSGDEFKLEIIYGDQKLSAITTVPQKPQNLILKSETLLIPNITTGIRNLPDLDYYSTSLTWDNFDNGYYYVVIENIENNPIAINIQSGRFATRFVSAPTISNEFKVSFRTVTHLGNHLMILYKVNQEYVDLYESRDQDSRNLNEPLTNIENGLGVFSAFASDSVYFNARME